MASLSLVVSFNENYQSIHKLAFVPPFSWIFDITEGKYSFFFFFALPCKDTSLPARVLRVLMNNYLLVDNGVGSV